MRFHPQQNVLITGTCWDSPRDVPRAGGFISLTIEGLPPGLGRTDIPCVRLAPVEGSPLQCSLSGPVDGLASLAGEWRGAGRDLQAAGDALAAALHAHLGRRACRPLVVGILNVTPDSFSDGGLHADTDTAVARGLQMVEEGAEWIDVGGESTRPGALDVDDEEEARRVAPVIRRLSEELSVPISVDTRKASVARSALEAGASIVNDVSGLTHDPGMAGVVAGADAGLVLMHTSGDPRTMMERTRYCDVVADVARFLRTRAESAVEAGVSPEKIWIDPGFGFGKTVEQNLTLLRRLREFTSIGLPVFVGTSRKSTIGTVLGGLPADQRLEGTAATVTAAVMNGAAAVRVHDVRAMARVVRMAAAVSGVNTDAYAI